MWSPTSRSFLLLISPLFFYFLHDTTLSFFIYLLSLHLNFLAINIYRAPIRVACFDLLFFRRPSAFFFICQHPCLQKVLDFCLLFFLLFNRKRHYLLDCNVSRWGFRSPHSRNIPKPFLLQYRKQFAWQVQSSIFFYSTTVSMTASPRLP